MTTTILVLGAPGNVGTEVVYGLQNTGTPFRIGAYNSQNAQSVFGDDADIVHFDFLNPETYAQTFDGIESMFLVRPPTLSNVQRDIAPAITAAVDTGVKHIVFLSIQGVERNHFVPHYKIEQFILTTGIDYTFLRAGFFMQNLSTTHVREIKEWGEIALPVGKAKTSFIDVRDLGAVAVQALIDETHRNRSYTLTGYEALTYDEIAQILSKVLNRRIRYTDPFILKFIWQQLKLGRKFGYVLVMAGLYLITRFGNASEVSDDVQSILHHPPMSFEQFAQDYRHCWEDSDK